MKNLIKKSGIITIGLLISICLNNLSFAQGFCKAFYVMDGGGADRIFRNHDNTFLILGTYNDTYLQDYHSLITKIDSSGNFLWQKYIQFYDITSDNDMIDVVTQSKDKGWLLMGYTGGEWSPFLHPIAIIKIDSAGEYEWAHVLHFGVRNNDAIYNYVQSVVESPDGGYVGTGNAYSDSASGSHRSDIMVFKINSEGYPLWYKRYDFYNTESGYDIFLTSDSGFVVLSRNENYYTSDNLSLLKLDNKGNLLWSKRLKTDSASGINYFSFSQNSSGDFYITGRSGADSSALIIKLDSSGNFIWKRSLSLGGRGYGAGASISNNNGGVTVSGTYFEGVQRNHFLADFKGSGEMNWVKTYTDSSLLGINGIAVNNKGEYFIGGWSSENLQGTIYGSQIIIKTDSAGNSCCFKNVTPTYFRIDTLNVLVENISYRMDSTFMPEDSLLDSAFPPIGSTGSNVIDLCDTTVSVFQPEIQTNILLFPNPSTGTIKISSADYIKEIDVYDIYGKKIVVAENNILHNSFTMKYETTEPLNIDLNHLNPGLYFVKIFFKTNITSQNFKIFILR